MVKKHAFTLVEVVISMMIIMIIAIGSLPVLTKSKPQIESVTLRGQYGCWIENNQLYQWYFDERTPRTSAPEPVSSCVLRLDQRPANFYILASGAGNDVMQGQAKSLYTPALSNELAIQLGKTALNETHTTTVSSGASAEVIANGPSASSVVYANGYPNGIIQENIGAKTDSCMIVSAPSCAKSCEVVDIVHYQNDTGTYTNEGRQVRVNGCTQVASLDDYNTYGNQRSLLIPLNELTYSAMGGGFNPEIVGSLAQNTIASANSYYWQTAKPYADENGIPSATQAVFAFNFKFIDSSYMMPQNLLGYAYNNQYTHNADTKSKMAKIIETIPIRRNSALTDLLFNLNPGALNKDGAVLILW